MNASKKILVIGTFDSKKTEYLYLLDKLKQLGEDPLLMDVGPFSAGLDTGDMISADRVSCAAEVELTEVRSRNDRGFAMKTMAKGAAILTRELFDQGRLAGVIGMGGSGGSSVIASAMQALPVGIPKVLLTTMAGGQTRSYVGTRDVTLIPSIADISGVNRISSMMIDQAASAVVGMAQEFRMRRNDQGEKKVVAASMFGNTTECVTRCRELLEARGLEVIVFHATGTGGQAMEDLIDDGLVDGCLDITTTELADEVCGGILSAGPNRLSAAGRRGIPQLVVPGCVDMANFGPIDSIPDRYKDGNRRLYEWNPSITLLRTNVEENRTIGRMMAGKLNAANGPVAVLLPLRGVSILDGDGERFCDREADSALFDALKESLNESVPVHEMDCNINDPEFADRAVAIFCQLLGLNGEP